MSQSSTNYTSRSFSYFVPLSSLPSTSNVTNSSSSSTSPEPTCSTVFASFGIFGNVLALIVLVKSAHKHKWKVFYKMITTLSCVDLLGILTTSPVVITVYLNNLKWVGGQHLCDYFSFMLIFSGLSTCLIISAMALDRYIAIVHPFKYRIIPKDKIVKFVIAGILIFSIFISFLPIFGLGQNVVHFPGTWCFPDFHNTDSDQAIVSYFYSFLIVLLVLMTAILNIWACGRLIVGKRSDVRRDSNISYTGTSRSKRHADVYIMILLVAIFIIFAVCWLPFVVRILLNQFTNATEDTDKMGDLYTLRLASLNQILDPWVYLLFRRESLRKCMEHIGKHANTKRFRFLSFSSQSNTQLEDDGYMERVVRVPSQNNLKNINSSESSMKTIETTTDL